MAMEATRHSIVMAQQAWNRVCDAWNTVVYASQILRVLQEEEDSSVELLCRRLVENEPKLLQLGWMMVGDYYTSKELDELVDAMTHNTSVSTISIGWSLRPYSIHRILQEAVMEMPHVENLSLVLHSSLRMETLIALKENPLLKLKRLQIQNVQLRRRSYGKNRRAPPPPPAGCNGNDSNIGKPFIHGITSSDPVIGFATSSTISASSSSMTTATTTTTSAAAAADDTNSYYNYYSNNNSLNHGLFGCWWLFAPRELWIQDYNIVEVVSDWHQLETLQLLDCDLQHEQIAYLCQQAMRRPKPWQELSVAYNPHIGMKALVCLLKQSNCRRLDMTSCNITPPGARWLAETLLALDTVPSLEATGIVDPSLLPRPSSPLESLCVARNVYMGFGALTLIKNASHRLLKLDISHCQLPVEKVWEAILPEDPKDDNIVVLEHLTIQGYTDYPGLEAFLKRNLPSLQTLQLSSSSTTNPISKQTETALLNGIKANYYIQEVVVFVEASTAMSTRWREFDFALQLNRIGRCILHQQQHNHFPTTVGGRGCSGGLSSYYNRKQRRFWSQVLAKASNSPECLFWLLQNGVGNWNNHLLATTRSSASATTTTTIGLERTALSS